MRDGSQSRRPPCRSPRYSTSITWRPPYQPQLPHTMWGSLDAPQFGHSECGGRVSRSSPTPRPGGGPARLALRDGHRCSLRDHREEGVQRVRARASAAPPTGDRCRRPQSHCVSLRSAPQLGQSPAQSSVHSGASGSSSRTASRTSCSRSSVVVERVGLAVDRARARTARRRRRRGRPRPGAGSGCRPPPTARRPRPGRRCRRGRARGWRGARAVGRDRRDPAPRSASGASR